MKKKETYFMEYILRISQDEKECRKIFRLYGNTINCPEDTVGRARFAW